MSNEMIVYDQTDIAVNRAPQEVLSEAMTAAKALQEVVSKKTKPVKFNGEQYLEFEDWQTVARFYGITAKVIGTEFVDYGGVQGFVAKSDAIRNDGMVVSSAEAMCMSDEPNWKSKPLFQLRSMAQTRACAKALRNCLSWVVVLAGYRPTPAEEIQDMANGGNKPPVQQPQSKSGQAANAPADGETITALIDNVEVKSGTKKDGTKWTKYGIHAYGSVYGTFSETLGAVADSLKGKEAVITFKHEGNFLTCTDIKPVPVEETIQEPFV